MVKIQKFKESNTEDKGILTGNVVNTDIEMEIAKTIRTF